MSEQGQDDVGEDPSEDLDYGEWDAAPPAGEAPRAYAPPEMAPPGPTDELVHWMDPRPLRAGPAAITLTAAGCFVLGIGAAVGTLALMHWLGPERELVVRRRGA
jgi:hypothetical protein